MRISMERMRMKIVWRARLVDLRTSTMQFEEKHSNAKILTLAILLNRRLRLRLRL